MTTQQARTSVALRSVLQASPPPVAADALRLRARLARARG